MSSTCQALVDSIILHLTCTQALHPVSFLLFIALLCFCIAFSSMVDNMCRHSIFAIFYYSWCYPHWGHGCNRHGSQQQGPSPMILFSKLCLENPRWLVQNKNLPAAGVSYKSMDGHLHCTVESVSRFLGLFQNHAPDQDQSVP